MLHLVHLMPQLRRAGSCCKALLSYLSQPGCGLLACMQPPTHHRGTVWYSLCERQSGMSVAQTCLTDVHTNARLTFTQTHRKEVTVLSSVRVPCIAGWTLNATNNVSTHSQRVLVREGAGHDVPRHLRRLTTSTGRSCCCQALHRQQALRMQLEE